METHKKINLRTNPYFSIFKPIKFLFFASLILLLGTIIKRYLSHQIIFYAGLVLSLIFIIRYIYQYVFLKSIRYTITASQIMYQRGVFTIHKDFIELYRIKDYVETHTFLMRLIGGMTLTLITSDKTHPEFHLIGINKSNIGEQLRILVEINRKNKRVYEVD